MTKAAKSAAKPKANVDLPEERDDDLDDTITNIQPDDEPERLPSEADLAAMNADSRAMLDNVMDAYSPMSLADVNAILADNYPGYTPTDPRGTSSGLQFTLPDGKSINVQRKRVKACANMEELRAYVGGLL